MDMRCNNCGAEVANGQLICGNCGAYVSSSATNTYQQQNQFNPTNPYNNQSYSNNMYNNQFSSNNPYNQNNNYQNWQSQNQGLNQYNSYNPYNNHNMQYQAYQSAPQQGMKWFKFIIWFQLWVNMLSCFYYGYRMLCEKAYMDEDMNNLTERVYGIFPNLQTSDKIIGICFVVCGLAAVFTRFMLSGYKKCGPFLYIGLLLTELVVSTIYVLIVISTLKDRGYSTDFIEIDDIYVEIVVDLVLIVLNIIYFNKRKHLFVN